MNLPEDPRRLDLQNIEAHVQGYKNVVKFHEFSEAQADDFVVGDLRDQSFCRARKSYAQDW